MDLTKDTMVLFTSDNGPEYPGGSTARDRNRDLCGGSPGRLRGMKRHLYEGGIRVPGIIRRPGHVRAGSRCTVAAGSIDILPTFCELAGVRTLPDRTIDGISIVPLLTGKAIKRSKPLCWNINYTAAPNMTIRSGDHVVVGFASKPSEGQTLMQWIKTANLKRFEMYDVRKDPAQKEELSVLQPVRLENLVSQMKEMWADLKKAGPVWEGYKGAIKPVQLDR
jgi:arylsulfatase A